MAQGEGGAGQVEGGEALDDGRVGAGGGGERPGGQPGGRHGVAPRGGHPGPQSVEVGGLGARPGRLRTLGVRCAERSTGLLQFGEGRTGGPPVAEVEMDAGGIEQGAAQERRGAQLPGGGGRPLQVRERLVPAARGLGHGRGEDRQEGVGLGVSEPLGELLRLREAGQGSLAVVVQGEEHGQRAVERQPYGPAAGALVGEEGPAAVDGVGDRLGPAPERDPRGAEGRGPLRLGVGAYGVVERPGQQALRRAVPALLLGALGEPQGGPGLAELVAGRREDRQRGGGGLGGRLVPPTTPGPARPRGTRRPRRPADRGEAQAGVGGLHGVLAVRRGLGQHLFEEGPAVRAAPQVEQCLAEPAAGRRPARFARRVPGRRPVQQVGGPHRVGVGQGEASGLGEGVGGAAAQPVGVRVLGAQFHPVAVRLFEVGADRRAAPGADRVEPGRALVPVGPVLLGLARVHDLLDQASGEAESRSVRPDQAVPDEPVEGGREFGRGPRLGGGTGERREFSGGEVAAQDRREPQGPLFGRVEGVDPGADERLERQRDAVGVDGFPGDEQLLQVQRVSADPGEDLGAERCAVGRPSRQFGREELRLGVGEAAERHGARGELGPDVEQRGAGEQEDQDGRGVPEGAQQPVEGVEEGLGSPVAVVDHQHDGPGRGQFGEDLGERRAGVGGRGVGGAVQEQPLLKQFQFGRRYEGGLGVQQVGHGVGERAEAGLFAEGPAAPDAVARCGGGGRGGRPADPLPYEPGLALAGLPAHHQPLDPAGPCDPLQRGVDQVEFMAAADEAEVEAAQCLGAVLLVEAGQPVGDDPVGLALEQQGPELGRADAGSGGGEGVGPDEDLPRGGVLFQAGGDVDHFAGDHRLPEGGRTRHRLTGVDADAHLQTDPDGLLEAGVEPGERLPHGECGRGGAPGVVLPYRRHTEDGHHGVPDELLHGAALFLDPQPHQVEPAERHRAQGLRVQRAGKRGGAHEVAEQDGHDLPTGGPCGDRPGRARAAAGRAEPCVGRQGAPARGAGHGFLRWAGTAGATGVRRERRRRRPRAPAPRARRRRAVP